MPSCASLYASQTLSIFASESICQLQWGWMIKDQLHTVTCHSLKLSFRGLDSGKNGILDLTAQNNFRMSQDGTELKLVKKVFNINFSTGAC